MSDVAFLTMDLAAHHRSGLAFRFLDAWLQHSGDYAGMAVFRFYEVYRSLVRALASSLAADSTSQAAPHGESHGRSDDVPDYIATAARLTQGAPGGPRLLTTYGFSGSGKSSVALKLLQEAGAVRIRSDVERKRLFGLDAFARSSGHGIDLYAASATRRTFDHLKSSATAVLQAGYPVVIHVHWPCRSTTLRQRVARRTALDNDASDARAAECRRTRPDVQCLHRHRPRHRSPLCALARSTWVDYQQAKNLISDKTGHRSLDLAQSPIDL